MLLDVQLVLTQKAHQEMDIQEFQTGQMNKMNCQVLFLKVPNKNAEMPTSGDLLQIWRLSLLCNPPECQHIFLYGGLLNECNRI